MKIILLYKRGLALGQSALFCKSKETEASSGNLSFKKDRIKKKCFYTISK